MRRAAWLAGFLAVAGCPAEEAPTPLLSVDATDAGSGGGDTEDQPSDPGPPSSDSEPIEPDDGPSVPDGTEPVSDAQEDAVDDPLPCVEDCPEGMLCQGVETGADVVFLCVPAHDFVCRPCSFDADCNDSGPVLSECLDYGDEGSFCGGPCNDEVECPEGYLCDESQCRLAEGQCDCSDAAILGGAQTECVVQAADGACPGLRACTIEGLSDCEAEPMDACDEPICIGDQWTCVPPCDGVDCDDADPCTADACSGGECVYEPAPGPCDDGDVCTGPDTCADAACIGLAIECDDDIACTSDACDADDGCVFLPHDAECDDGIDCTSNACQADGGCVLTVLDEVCDDGSECTVDTCDPETGCSNDAQGGCDDANPCTLDSCADGSCVNEVAVDQPCDDGDACTQDEVCVAQGACEGAAVECPDDAVDCTVDSCDPAIGCISTPDDGLCDAAGTACQPSTGCSPLEGCQFETLSDDTACDDDGLACAGSWCQSGQCVEVPGCDDGEACTVDTCTEDGCTSEAAEDGASCSIDPCDTATCQGGQCYSDAPCPEIQVNLYNQQDQLDSRVEVLPNGKLVTVWASKGEDQSGWAIAAQRHDSSGLQDVLSFVVNASTEGDQTEPQVAVKAGGEPVVVWRDQNGDANGWGIKARRLSADVTGPVGDEVVVNLAENANESQPAIVALSGGGVAIGWHANKDPELRVRLFDAALTPIGDELAMNSYEIGQQDYAEMAPLEDGAFMAAWDSSYADGSGWGVYGQRFTSDGAKQGPELSLTSSYLYDQNHVGLATFPDSKAVVTWRSNHIAYNRYFIHAQRLSAIGLKLGPEMKVSIADDFSTEGPRVATSPDGWFTVVWTVWHEDGDKRGIKARSYTPSGEPVGDPEMVNQATAGEQLLPDVAMLPGRRPAVIYQSWVAGAPGWDIYLRVLPPLGVEPPEDPEDPEDPGEGGGEGGG